MVKRRRHRQATAARPAGDPAPGGPPAGVRRIMSPAEALRLVDHLCDPARAHPVVVVTISSDQREPWIDAEDVAGAVRGLAEVVLLPTDPSSWAFAEALPDKTQVYGGAGRVYPVGLEWTVDPASSPLRFAYGPHDAERATERLVADAMGMARASRPTADAGPEPPRRATGVVRQLVEPSRALVALEDGGLATIWQELTVAGVTIGQLLTPGQVVRGVLDHEKRLDITAGLRAATASVAHYAPDDVVLVRVDAVRPDVVHLALHPEVVVPVPRDRVTTNPSDSLLSLFTVGEVVVARVAQRDESRLVLRLDDVDDEDDPRPAASLLEGGPPWLTQPDLVLWDPAEEPADEPRTEPPAASTPTDAAARPAPAPSPVRGAVRSLSLTLEAAQARVAELERALAMSQDEAHNATGQLTSLRSRVVELEERSQELAEQVTRQRAQLRNEKQRAQKAARRSSIELTSTADTPLFSDPVEQFEHEVKVEWATRIPAGEKADRALKQYALGPEFLTSLDQVEGVSRGKVVQVVVEVLTGLAEQLDSREVHWLRRGAGANSPQVVRDGGWACWRAALQRETPSARRLHYWVRGDEVELSRVALHDDMRP